MAAKPSMLSEEFVGESSDEEGQDNITLSKPAPKKAEVSIPAGKAPNSKKTISLEQDLESDAVSEEDDVEEDEEASDSEHGDFAHSMAEPSPLLNEKKRPITVANVQDPPRKKMKATAKMPVAIPAREYHPPNGFERSVYASKDLTADSMNFLSADLSGKQVWHITAPASVDIKSIDGFSIKDVLSGKPILIQNGSDYGFCTESQRNEKLLLADIASTEYAQAKVISKTFHLREITTANAALKRSKAEIENHAIHFTAQGTLPKNQPRQQPAGLRMRYHPFGSVDEPHQSSPRENGPSSLVLVGLLEDDMEEPLDSEKTIMRKEKRSKKKQSGPEIEATQIERISSSSVIEEAPLQSSQAMSELAGGQSTPKVSSAKKEKRLKKKKKHHIADEISA